MPYKDNTPTFNVNRKVVNYKDFLSNVEAEKEELKKVRRSTKPNSEDQQHIGNSRYKFNNVTRKMDDLSPAEIEDKINSVQIKENDEHDEYYDNPPQTPNEVADKWYEKTDDSFFVNFIEEFPSKQDLNRKLPKYSEMIEYLEDNYSFPGEDYLYDFFKDLDNVNW